MTANQVRIFRLELERRLPETIEEAAKIAKQSGGTREGTEEHMQKYSPVIVILDNIGALSKELELSSMSEQLCAWLSTGGDRAGFEQAWPDLWRAELERDFGAEKAELLLSARYGTSLESREKAAALEQWKTGGGDPADFERLWPGIWKKIVEATVSRYDNEQKTIDL
jgi:hypothetical protein